ncbi:nucleotidyltransferase domain-containing protein [Streptomyces wedmorensis]|uniref:nucleotidyltransferase domain-containing protein n=1 Tax=Streptomyces wedmorensis TaxID=43759 RepID=UPI0037B3BF3A
MSSPHSGDTYPLPVSVAFSGPDNSGKTKRIGILARRMGRAAASAGPLDHYDPRWAAIKAGGMARWWFETGPVEEVADVLATSYLERSRHPFSAPVRLLDRGIPMLEASVAATVAVREDLGAEQAADRARILLAPYETDLRAAEESEHTLVLLHCDDPEEGTRRSLAHEVTVTGTYAAYQHHLHEQLNRLVDEGRFPMAVRIGDRPTVAIQDEVRRLLAPRHPDVPGRALAGVHITALGGMSESGKSTAGEYLRTQHGHARLKIGYLIEDAAGRAGIHDPYGLGSVVQAELIVDALDRFCQAHHFLDSVSIESLHDIDSTAELARMLGPQLTIAYLDASEATRSRRGTAGAQDVADRDLVALIGSGALVPLWATPARSGRGHRRRREPARRHPGRHRDPPAAPQGSPRPPRPLQGHRAAREDPAPLQWHRVPLRRRRAHRPPRRQQQDTSLVTTARIERPAAETLARLVLQVWLDTLPGESQ